MESSFCETPVLKSNCCKYCQRGREVEKGKEYTQCSYTKHKTKSYPFQAKMFDMEPGTIADTQVSLRKSDIQFNEDD